MKLRLDKYPFTDPMIPGFWRFLLEGTELVKQQACHDFYMYLWIDTHLAVHGFQIVVNDDITLNFRVPQQLSFGRISSDVIDRGITDIENDADRVVVRDAVKSMEHEQLQQLCDQIKKLVEFQSFDSPLTLTDAEREYIATILKK